MMTPSPPEIRNLSIAAALREGTALLAKSGTETPRLDAEVLLRHVLGLDRTAFFARLPDPIPPVTFARYRELLGQRARCVPVAYLTGQREFMGLPFMVAPGVLVPRPETEILVEWALSLIQARDFSTVVDVGTGSGAIALSIAANLHPTWRGHIIAADVSPTALALAAQNRGHLLDAAPTPPSPVEPGEREGGWGVRVCRRDAPPATMLEQQIALVRGSLLTWLRGPVDLILANLPYLRPQQIDGNPDLAAEPRQALDGGADGLALIRHLVADAPRVLAAGGALGLEIDSSQCEAVSRLVRHAFPAGDLRVLRDLAGLDRHVVVQT
jgi:release factor glutamine methyltransferase